MPHTRFGLYLIPEGKFYVDGSAVVGYDIRGQLPVKPPSFIDPSWVSTSQEYGFHATITDAIEIDDSKLPTVAARIKDLLACFRSGNEYTLKKTSVGFWRAGSNQAAIQLQPNRKIELLHDVLVTAIHPLGQGSEYLEQYRNDKVHYFDSSPSQVQKTKQFFSPYIFEEFVPHFTCINPFNGTSDQRRRLESDLRHLFKDVDELKFSKLSLVTRAPDDAHYRIIEDFTL
jgi:hypothetical protein